MTGITDFSTLTRSLVEKNALQFLKELDLSNNKIRDSKQLRDVIQDSNCTLRVDCEQTLVGSGRNLIGGWFTSWSNAQDLVNSTGTDLTSSDEESSEGDIVEEEEPGRVGLDGI
ncbi:hypothetical protein R3I93_016967 [Phoxinus phoxinus]|uniref:Uncharacterized protein n=1 Tax=Phoxinus phoxinus TaxID=58324 RepID=A0AAN9CJW3_9TELE